MDNTVDWLRNLGVFLHQEDLAEKAVVQEKDKLFAFADKVKKITQGKETLSLAHFELGILLADHVKFALTLDDLAVLRTFLDECSYFHGLQAI